MFAWVAISLYACIFITFINICVRVRLSACSNVLAPMYVRLSRLVYAYFLSMSVGFYASLHTSVHADTKCVYVSIYITPAHMYLP